MLQDKSIKAIIDLNYFLAIFGQVYLKSSLWSTLFWEKWQMQSFLALYIISVVPISEWTKTLWIFLWITVLLMWVYSCVGNAVFQSSPSFMQWLWKFCRGQICMNFLFPSLSTSFPLPSNSFFHINKVIWLEWVC